MKILQYTLGAPPHRTGGSTKYFWDLMQAQLKAGHEVHLLYPGHYDFAGKTRIRKEGRRSGVEIHAIINPLPVSLLRGVSAPDRFYCSTDKGTYLRFLQELAPDIIHLHTLMGVHKEFLEAAKELGIKTTYTTHDYYGICPKLTLFDFSDEACETFDDGIKCVQCNVNTYSMPLIYLMQSRAYKRLKYNPIVAFLRRFRRERFRKGDLRAAAPVERQDIKPDRARQYVTLRNYYLDMFQLVDYFHFNSHVSKEEHERYLDLEGGVISITHAGIKDHRKRRDFGDAASVLRITYLGPLDAYKGFYLLKQALEQLATNGVSNWHLAQYGDFPHGDLQYDERHFSFNGRYAPSDLGSIFDETDVLAVPSLWKETFGFVGLEAFSHGVPTLVSSNVGFKDVIKDGETGIVVEATVEALCRSIQAIVGDRTVLERINRNILAMDFGHSMRDHAESIMQLYRRVREGRT